MCIYYMYLYMIHTSELCHLYFPLGVSLDTVWEYKMIQSLIYQLALLQSHSCTSHANQARPLKSTPDYSSSWNFYLEFTASLISKLLTTKARWETCFHYKLCGEFKIESWILLRIFVANLRSEVMGPLLLCALWSACCASRSFLSFQAGKCDVALVPKAQISRSSHITTTYRNIENSQDMISMIEHQTRL